MTAPPVRKPLKLLTVEDRFTLFRDSDTVWRLDMSQPFGVRDGKVAVAVVTETGHRRWVQWDSIATVVKC